MLPSPAFPAAGIPENLSPKITKGKQKSLPLIYQAELTIDPFSLAPASQQLRYMRFCLLEFTGPATVDRVSANDCFTLAAVFHPLFALVLLFLRV